MLAVPLLILGWVSLSSTLFFSSDTGLRFLQVRELIANRWQTLAISYPLRAVDPALEHVPYYYAYVVIRDEIYLSISPLFTILTSFSYLIIGRLGLVLTPVFGTVLTAAAAAYLACLARLGRPRLVLWITGLGTPLLFYALELWDHSFVTAMAMWAVVFLARGVSGAKSVSVLIGGALTALAWSQRPEFAVLAAAIGLSLLVVARDRFKTLVSYAAGNLALAAPLGIVHMLWYGHPLGVIVGAQLFGYGVPEPYPVQPYANVELTRPLIAGRLITFVLSGDPLTFSATLLGLLGIVIIVFGLRVPKWRSRRALLGGLIVFAISYVLWLIVMSQMAVAGLLPTLPLLPLALAVAPEGDGSPVADRIYRFVLLAALLFLALMIAIYPAFGGLQWGARYLLPAYPLLVFLACVSFERFRRAYAASLGRTLDLLFVSLIVISIVVQFAGVAHLLGSRTTQRELRDELRALPATVILTNDPFLASHMSSLSEKAFLYVAGEDDLLKLAPRLFHNGIKRVAIVPYEPLSIPSKSGDIYINPGQPLIYDLSLDHATAGE